MDLTNHVQEEIFKAIQSLRYGSVEVIIHDSQIVQIERKEKVRLGGERQKQRRTGVTDLRRH